MCIYWIGYKALSQPAIFNNSLPFQQGRKEAGEAEVPAPAEAEEALQMNDGPAAAKYQKSGLKDEAADEYLSQLLRFMEERKPYLQNELSIQDLAAAIGIPRHHLSRVVNERLNKNFYDFINEYRVAEAKRLLLHPAFGHYTTLAIALEAGFSSKATFNAVFKKQTGLTPTAYVSKAKILV